MAAKELLLEQYNIELSYADTVKLFEYEYSPCLEIPSYMYNMWPVEKMENATGEDFMKKYGTSGEDYLLWDRHNNRGFLHAWGFVVLRFICSVIGYVAKAVKMC